MFINNKVIFQEFNTETGFNFSARTMSNMNHQQDNLLRLINKYSVRFGEHDPLVLNLIKEVFDLQLRQRQPIVLRSLLFESNVIEIELVPTV
jgi:hypothetical protein